MDGWTEICDYSRNDNDVDNIRILSQRANSSRPENVVRTDNILSTSPLSNTSQGGIYSSSESLRSIEHSNSLEDIRCIKKDIRLFNTKLIDIKKDHAEIQNNIDEILRIKKDIIQSSSDIFELRDEIRESLLVKKDIIDMKNIRIDLDNIISLKEDIVTYNDNIGNIQKENIFLYEEIEELKKDNIMLNLDIRLFKENEQKMNKTIDELKESINEIHRINDASLKEIHRFLEKSMRRESEQEMQLAELKKSLATNTQAIKKLEYKVEEKSQRNINRAIREYSDSGVPIGFMATRISPTSLWMD